MKKADFNLWYRYQAHTCAIENCKMFQACTMGVLNFHLIHALNKDNRIDFNRIFGKPDTYWRGSEFYFHVWIREFEGEKFVVMTAKGKGTCIEMCETDFDTINNKADVVMRFVQSLLHSLLGPSGTLMYIPPKALPGYPLYKNVI